MLLCDLCFLLNMQICSQYALQIFLFFFAFPNKHFYESTTMVHLAKITTIGKLGHFKVYIENYPVQQQYFKK